ncbi:MAG: chloride channel protein [Pseudonocardiaceae bacterium]
MSRDGVRSRLRPPPIRLPADGWRRGYDWLRGSAPGLVPLALLVGAGAGGGAVGFRYLILWFTEVFTGRADFSDAGRVASPHFPGLGLFFVIVVAVIGGLVYGPIVDRFAKEARGHGVPEVMLAIAERGGRIGPQVAIVKSLASALCIGSGGSVGREGPIVQIGSALGSSIGQALRISDARLRLLVACGAAGGISATFNAPIAGVFFALELILRDFATESFWVVVLASITADVIGQSAFGSASFLSLPAFHPASLMEYLFYAGLGILAAAVGVGFTRVLYGTEDLLDWLWRGPEWLRPAAGGLLLGLLLLALPQMYGVGYPVLEAGVRGQYVLWFLLILLVGKIVATSLTIGIGGSGGVFAPSLFMGAMLGTAYGLAAHQIFGNVVGPAGAYGLVGMGAVFAGAARAPITAVIIIFELTGNYTIILPLMATIALATGVSSLLSKDTIYTLKLRRRGIDLLRGAAVNLMELLTVADAMQPLPPALALDVPLNTVIDRIAVEGRDALPVVDEQGVYRGTVTARDLEDSVRANALEATAETLARAVPTLHPEQTLEQALTVLVQQDRSALPVVTSDNGEVLGWLTHRDVLAAYNTRLQRGVRQAQTPAGTAVLAPPPAVPASGSIPPPQAQHSVTRLQDYRLVDLELIDDSPPVGQPVAQVPWPPSSLLIGIRRDGAPFTASDDTRLERGDRLTLLVPAEHTDQVTEHLQHRPSTDT